MLKCCYMKNFNLSLYDFETLRISTRGAPSHGASIPPIRAHREAAPIPALRISVGNTSDENKYTEENAIVTRNFPKNDIAETATSSSEITKTYTNMLLIYDIILHVCLHVHVYIY